jgi:hypothetical protein
VNERKLNWATHEKPSDPNARWYWIDDSRILGVVTAHYRKEAKFTLCLDHNAAFFDLTLDTLREITDVTSEFGKALVPVEVNK